MTTARVVFAVIAAVCAVGVTDSSWITPPPWCWNEHNTAMPSGFEPIAGSPLTMPINSRDVRPVDDCAKGGAR